MKRLERDTALIYAAAFTRSATVGLVGVVLAIHLSGIGLSVTAIGAVIGTGLAGAAVATLIVSVRGDGFGRRRALIALGALMAAGYLALGAAMQIAALLPMAFLGMVNGMGRDRGAASALEQAILPDTAGPERRTWVLAWYNLTLDAGHAIGALAGMIPTVLVQRWHVDRVAAHQATFVLCAAAMVVGLVPYGLLSRRIETPAPAPSVPTEARLDPRTRSIVTRLAVLFGLDSIGGGFLNSSLIAYWFFRRYGTSESDVAVLFFAARSLNAMSHVGAAWMARRIGLINTMVLTHLPSSLFLMAAPAAPSATVAGVLFLAREALVEMDVPTRQSYVMAVVPARDRTFASGVTNLTRTVAWAIAPPLAGVIMQRIALAGPLFIGGALKIGYDLLLYGSFRHIKPPEESTSIGTK